MCQYGRGPDRLRGQGEIYRVLAADECLKEFFVTKYKTENNSG